MTTLSPVPNTKSLDDHDSPLAHLKALNRALFVLLHDDDNYWTNLILAEHKDIRATDLMIPAPFAFIEDLDRVMREFVSLKGMPYHTAVSIRKLMDIDHDQPTKKLDAVLRELVVTYALCYFVASTEQGVELLANQFASVVNLTTSEAKDQSLNPTLEELEKAAFTKAYNYAWPLSLAANLDRKLDTIRNRRRIPLYRWMKQIQAA